MHGTKKKGGGKEGKKEGKKKGHGPRDTQHLVHPNNINAIEQRTQQSQRSTVHCRLQRSIDVLQRSPCAVKPTSLEPMRCSLCVVPLGPARCAVRRGRDGVQARDGAVHKSDRRRAQQPVERRGMVYGAHLPQRLFFPAGTRSSKPARQKKTKKTRKMIMTPN